MGDLTKNLSRHEFECNCGCGMDTIDFTLVTMVQDAADHFARVLGLEKVTVVITGPNRCPAHNEAEGGASGSQHLYSRASDFKIKEVTPRTLYHYLDEKWGDKIGLGLYSNRVHLDSRGTRARWNATK